MQRCVLLTLFALTFGFSSVAAQDGPRYKHFPIEQDYQEFLRKRFQANKKLEPFKDLVQQILANPDKLPLSPEKLKNMKLGDDELKNLVRDWIAQDPKVQDSLKDWLKARSADKKQEPDIKKLEGELKAIVDDAAKKKTAASVPAPPPHGPGPIKSAPQEDRLAKLAERALRQAENGKLGEWLRESKSFQQAIEDLHGTMNDPTVPRWKMDGWQAGLLDPDSGAWRIGETALEQLRDMPRPDFEHLHWDFAPDAGDISAPNVGAPGFSGNITLGKTATWILLSLLILLVGFSLLRKRGAAKPQSARPQLGAWPIRPEAVATGADLVRAFDYLALGTLGLDAASWNHHAVARIWGEQAPVCVGNADALARLYERARYTPGANALGSLERDQARQALAQIAEAF